MTIVLRSGTSDNEFGDLPLNLDMSTLGNYIEFQCTAEAGNASDIYVLAGQDSGDAFFIELRPTAAVLRGSSVASYTTNYTQPPIDQQFIFRVVNTGAQTYECFLDGVSLGTQTLTLNLSLDQFFNKATSTTNAFHGLVYYIRHSSNGGTSVTNEWNPELSQTTTGTTLFDVVGTADVVLTNFPTDNSQWVTVSNVNIQNVDGDNVVEDGQQDVAVTLVNSTANATQVNLLGGGYSVALSDLQVTDANNLTVDIPDWTSFTSDTASIPFGANQIQVVNGVDTIPNFNITRNPRSGYLLTTLVNCGTGEGFITENRVAGAYADGSQVLYLDSLSTNINTDGSFQTSSTSDVTLWVWDIDTGVVEVVTAIADTATGAITFIQSATTNIIKNITNEIINIERV